MASVDSSGIAAPFSKLPCDQTREGSDRFLRLLERIREINNSTCADDGELDTRDYKAMAGELESVIFESLADASGPIREGFLRAMTYFMSVTADGCTPVDGWNPLHNTAMAFATEGASA